MSGTSLYGLTDAPVGGVTTDSRNAVRKFLQTTRGGGIQAITPDESRQRGRDCCCNTCHTKRECGQLHQKCGRYEEFCVISPYLFSVAYYWYSLVAMGAGDGIVSLMNALSQKRSTPMQGAGWRRRRVLFVPLMMLRQLALSFTPLRIVYMRTVCIYCISIFTHS